MQEEAKEAAKEQVDIPSVGYKISDAAKEKLSEYLNERPMAEVEPIFKNILETEVEDPMYSEAAISMVIAYLNEKCPRREAKPILDFLKIEGHITKYDIKPAAGEKKQD